MDVNSLPKTVTQQLRDCDLNPGPTAPESSKLTTRPPSHRMYGAMAYSRALKKSTVMVRSSGMRAAPRGTAVVKHIE